MKETYITEEELSNLNVVGLKLFCSEDAPQSPSYKRVLIRPKISYLSIVLHMLLPLVVGVIYLQIIIALGMMNIWAIGLLVISLFGYGALNFKKAIVCCIKIYQRYAPAHIRNKCRFEPSCSQYMILAIEKYGLINGMVKGINRLKRCNINNGGYDFP